MVLKRQWSNISIVMGVRSSCVSSIGTRKGCAPLLQEVPQKEESRHRGFQLELVGRFPLNGEIESLSVAYLANNGAASLIVCCRAAKVTP